jgi:hypothetical protein
MILFTLSNLVDWIILACSWLHGPEKIKAVQVYVHEHVRVNDHENDDRTSISILDNRSIPIHRGTALTKAVVVEVHVLVDVDGVFSLAI